MTGNESENRALCRRFVGDLYHFQAGELPDTDRHSMAEHAAECRSCGRRLEIENGLLRGLKQRLARTELPDPLRARVRDALERASARRSLPAWLAAPWLVPAAAALLLAAVLIPVLPRRTDVVRVVREVTVVDLACERAGRTIEQQRLCDEPGHSNALKIGPDEYWKVGLDHEVGRSLAADREMRGHRLRVEGEFYPGLDSIELTGMTDHGLVSLTASVRRHGTLLSASSWGGAAFEVKNERDLRGG